MSLERYPIGNMQDVQIEYLDRTVLDEMESGATYARRGWALNSARRKVRVQHSPLSLQEWDYLRAHYRTHGTWDSFWFRDNTMRTGNIKVRFSRPVSCTQRRSVVYPDPVELIEVAPVRLSPTVFDVQKALLLDAKKPLFWFDHNARYISKFYNQFQILPDEDFAWDSVGNHHLKNYGTFTNFSPEQWEKWYLAGANHGRSLINLTGLSGTQPAVTLFCFVLADTTTTRGVLFSAGAASTGSALGLSISASNTFEPYLGGSESWTGCVQSNATANIWRSIALVWPLASNTCTMYVNAASVGSGSNTRSYANGLVSVGANSAGNLLVTQFATINHVMAFDKALSAADVKTLHNMFAYQFGLADVP